MNDEDAWNQAIACLGESHAYDHSQQPRLYIMILANALHLCILYHRTCRFVPQISEQVSPTNLPIGIKMQHLHGR